MQMYFFVFISITVIWLNFLKVIVKVLQCGRIKATYKVLNNSLSA